MAVYTHLSENDIRQHLKGFDLGNLVSFAGITDGIENTNYRLTTTRGDFILTLFEKRTKVEDLPFFIGFMKYLCGKGMPCPHIVADSSGEKIVSINGKASVISTFLEGKSPAWVETFHAVKIAEKLALMHMAGRDFLMTRPNAMSFPAWKKLIGACGEKADTLEKGLAALLQDELAYLEKNRPAGLSEGAVHADLFPDNVFFVEKNVTGIIDFYFSCTDVFAYDLMLTLNAWCFDEGTPDAGKISAFLTAYRNVRPLFSGEESALPYFGRAAALRIIATRLYDYLHPAEGAVVKTKDPLEYVRILKFYREKEFPA